MSEVGSTCISAVSVEKRVTAFEFFSGDKFCFDLKSDAAFLTVCQGKTRNKAFTNVCILFYDVSKNKYRVSVIKFALQKTVHVDMRFSMDTDDILVSKVGLQCID